MHVTASSDMARRTPGVCTAGRLRHGEQVLRAARESQEPDKGSMPTMAARRHGKRT